MRPLRKLSPIPSSFGAARQATLLYSSSTNDDGGGGRGRGRGRGLLSPFSPAPDPPASRVPGRPQADPPFPLGRGRGREAEAAGQGPQIPPLPSFPSFLAPPPHLSRGRGRGTPSLSEPDPSLPKKPVFFRLPVSPQEAPSPDESPKPAGLPFLAQSGAGRGKERTDGPPKPAAVVGNRHVRQSASRGGGGRGTRGRGLGSRGDDSRSAGSGRGIGEAVAGGGRGRGRGGRGETYGSSRGRGGRMGRLRPRKESEFKGLYMGNAADGEKLERTLGEDGAAELRAALEEAGYEALPCPQEEAYRDSVHMNNLIEFEPEYLMEEFGFNPDIDEKPPMELSDAFKKMKPFLMEFEGIQTEAEWQEILKATMEKSAYLKAVVDKYSGPDRITAKEQQLELERITTTLPGNIPSSVKRFTERALLSLQSNPGWGFDKKCKFMNKLAYETRQHYK